MSATKSPVDTTTVVHTSIKGQDGKTYVISPGVLEALDKQEFPKHPQGMMSVWGLGAYSACFYAAWAGGGSAVSAGDYCEAKYL